MKAIQIRWMAIAAALSSMSTLTLNAQVYKNLNDIVADIQTTAAASSGAATAHTLKDSANVEIHTGGLTAPNTPIWCLKLAKPGGNGSRRILVTGTHHAREWVAYRAVLDAAQFILSHKDMGPTDWQYFPDSGRFSEFLPFKEMNLKALLENAEINFVPIVNPEGYYYSKQVVNGGQGDPTGDQSGGGWRKNRRDVSVSLYAQMTGEPSGSPLEGVDLNRNYPAFDWGKVTYNAQGYETTSRWRWEEVYCGRPVGGAWTVQLPYAQPGGPGLEKETEAVEVLSAANAFDCQIDVHSYGGQVGWVPTASTSDQNPGLRPDGGLSDLAVFQILAGKAAELIADPGPIGGTYEAKNPYDTSGDSLVRQYERRNHSCLAFLIEIGKWPEFQGQFRPTVPSPTAYADTVLPGQLFMMFAAVDKSFSSKPTAQFRKP